MESQRPKIIVIVGPTASGKTSLSIELAKNFNGEVVSADSRQVYKGLDIGTEKVTREEMDGVKHHMLDVVDVDTVYSADNYRSDASLAISDILKHNKLPIVAGGTFFYIDMLLGRISTPTVEPDYELRERLEEKTVSELFKLLQKLDPNRAATIDQSNKRRLIRALEIIDSLGTVPKSYEVECPYDVFMLGIEVDRVTLRKRIRERAEKALTRGLIEETQELLQSGIKTERLKEIGLEYRIILEYLDGNLTDDALKQKLEEKNWQYAKRQLMWLKRDDSINWFNIEDNEAITEKVHSFITTLPH